MEATIVERRRSRRAPGAAGLIAYLGAAAFALAAGWYGLAMEGVTVARQPVFGANESLAHKLDWFYRWFVSTLPQERVYTSLAILAFLCLAAVGILAARSMRPATPLAGVAAMVLALGASLWIVGSVVQLGGHRAVGAMATHANPLPTVNSISFTIDIIDDAFETAAFAIIGVAMLGLASVGIRTGVRAWGRYTAAIGAISLVVAGAYIVDNGDVVDVLLLALGVVILPVWLVWTGTLYGTAADEPSGTAGRLRAG
jgi:hypothetical protein